MKRTEYCGALRAMHIGMAVTVCGWVQTKRDMGGVIFLDLRDREGTLQVVLDASALPEKAFAMAENLRNQSVLMVMGTIRMRDADTINPKLQTGTIELVATQMEVISLAEPLPFSLEDDAPTVREDLRLQYRFLDIRRPSLYQNLKFRHTVQKITRHFLEESGFLEVETPILTKSTPEGARDYVVPSRVHPGKFYALPQSPQIFKQLLMVGGIDKYYQIARCFRDEDLRADRQPEFTQVDMELSFVDQEEILIHLEELFRYIMKEAKGILLEKAFPRITWTEAMDKYGSDKPDLRFGLPIIDLTELAKTCSFSVFHTIVEKGGVVRAINVKGHGDFSRSAIEELTEKAMHCGAKGMAWIAIKPDGELYSVLTKYFTQTELEALLQAVDGKPNDFILFCADTLSTVRRTLGTLRLELGAMLGLQSKENYQFVIVTAFPQFEYSEEKGRYIAAHHPFTMPYPEDIPYLCSHPERVRAQAYDVVLNGIELGSGSVRIHQQDVQKKMFEALGFSEEEIEEQFGFFVNAFQYGTPPHAGFAFGLDRFVMLLVGADSLREVIAFPKRKDASCPMTDAPTFIDRDQLDGLHLMEHADPKEKASNKMPLLDVDAVANLANLSFSAIEKERMQQDLGAILTFANQLKEVDTTNCSILSPLVPLQNRFHEDRCEESPFCREALLANAPTTNDGYITVPQVVE